LFPFFQILENSLFIVFFFSFFLFFGAIKICDVATKVVIDHLEKEFWQILAISHIMKVQKMVYKDPFILLAS
jgi:hypothetical protein